MNEWIFEIDNYPRIPKKVKQEIIRLYNDGWFVEDIAARLGTTFEKVDKVVTQFEETPRQ